MYNKDTLKRVCEELKELAKGDIPIIMPIIDNITQRRRENVGPGESYLLIDEPIQLRITLCPPPNISDKMELKIIKRRKGDIIVNNNEQQTIFGAFCSKE